MEVVATQPNGIVLLRILAADGWFLETVLSSGDPDAVGKARFYLHDHGEGLCETEEEDWHGPYCTVHRCPCGAEYVLDFFESIPMTPEWLN